MRRLLVAPLIFTLLSPVNALSEEKYVQCPIGSEQSCIDLLVAYGACAWIKFKNDGKGDEAISYADSFFNRLLNDNNLSPTSEQLNPKDKRIRNRRINYADVICPSVLDEHALKEYNSKTNQEEERPMSLRITKVMVRSSHVLSFGLGQAVRREEGFKE